MDVGDGRFRWLFAVGRVAAAAAAEVTPRVVSASHAEGAVAAARDFPLLEKEKARNKSFGEKSIYLHSKKRTKHLSMA